MRSKSFVETPRLEARQKEPPTLMSRRACWASATYVDLIPTGALSAPEACYAAARCLKMDSNAASCHHFYDFPNVRRTRRDFSIEIRKQANSGAPASSHFEHLAALGPVLE
jgi:hypothetical protein